MLADELERIGRVAERQIVAREHGGQHALGFRERDGVEIRLAEHGGIELPLPPLGEVARDAQRMRMIIILTHVRTRKHERPVLKSQVNVQFCLLSVPFFPRPERRKNILFRFKPQKNRSPQSGISFQVLLYHQQSILSRYF